MNTDKVKLLQSLDAQKRETEDRLKEIKKQREVLEQEVLDMFAEAGISSLKVDGKTVSIRRELWAGPKDGDKDAACIYLKTHGLEAFVNETFNSLTVSAWVRERDTDGDLPADFKEFFNVTEKYKVITRR